MTVFDDSLHPDLVDLDARIRFRLDSILQAEQEAAAVYARRTTTLRDRLIDLEEGGLEVAVSTTTGRHRGTLTMVGRDHLELDSPEGHVVVRLRRVVALEWG
jgi:hypothetical protein